MSGVTDIGDRLSSCSEDLADLAVTLLKAAVRAGSDGERAELVAREKRVTRARRAVEKARALLQGTDDA